MRQLYAYQKNVVEYIKSNPQAAVFLQMRLGKSLCVIRALQHASGRKLIICPKSVINTWCDELDMEEVKDYLWFSSEFIIRGIHNMPVNKIDFPTWTICNYEAVSKLSKETLGCFHQIIIDESVNIKNPKAKITKFVLNNFEGVERRIILSGNPAPNSPLEYFTQMKFLYGSWLGCDNFWQFRKRYCTSDLQGWQWWTRHSSKEVMRIDLQKHCFFLSRQEVGVENKKVYEKRSVEMPKSLEREYKRMEKELVANLPDGKKVETKYVLPKLLYLQEMASGHLVGHEMANHKIKELVSLLEGELKGEQVLVWCRFRWEIDAINKSLIGIYRHVICGDTPLDKRKVYQQLFNEGSTQVLILQTQTSKYGLNLSAADTSIYFSNTFSSDDREQSEMRVEHNSKKRTLLYIDLITKNTIDEDILMALKKKQKDAAYFMHNIIVEVKKRHV